MDYLEPAQPGASRILQSASLPDPGAPHRGGNRKASAGKYHLSRCGVGCYQCRRHYLPHCGRLSGWTAGKCHRHWRRRHLDSLYQPKRQGKSPDNITVSYHCPGPWKSVSESVCIYFRRAVHPFQHCLEQRERKGRGTPPPAETSQVTFDNVDFGPIGSDTVTLPLFTYSVPFPIEIWEGVPGTPKSLHICAVTYDSGWAFNTYIPQTFTLPRRLKGVTSIPLCFSKRCI